MLGGRVTFLNRQDKCMQQNAVWKSAMPENLSCTSAVIYGVPWRKTGFLHKILFSPYLQAVSSGKQGVTKKEKPNRYLVLPFLPWHHHVRLCLGSRSVLENHRQSQGTSEHSRWGHFLNESLKCSGEGEEMLKTGTWSSPWCEKSQDRLSFPLQLVNTKLPNMPSVP